MLPSFYYAHLVCFREAINIKEGKDLTPEEKLLKVLIEAVKLGYAEIQHQNIITAGMDMTQRLEYDKAFKLVAGPGWYDAHEALMKAVRLLEKHEAKKDK